MLSTDSYLCLQGVLLTHRAVVATVAAQLEYLGLVGSTMGGGLGPNDVMLSYLPLAHIFDRCTSPRRPTSRPAVLLAAEKNGTAGRDCHGAGCFLYMRRWRSCQD